MKHSSRRSIISRLLWVIVALCVLVACGYIMVHNLFQGLPPLWRILALMGGWMVAFLLILKALPERRESASGTERANFPSLALKKILDTYEALDVGFVALDGHARVVLSNSVLGKLIDVQEASAGAGLTRALHPDNAHVFKNTFQEVCQSASGTSVLKLRSFDRMQQTRHLHVALTRWKEAPAAVIGIVWDISDTEQLRQETQMVKAALHDFHGVFAAEGSNLLDTMRALLELGNLHFKVELGLVAKLHHETTERLEVVQVLAPHEELSRGQIFDPLTASHPNFPRVLAHASFVCGGNEALPPSVYKATRHETFLGAPIYVQRQLFGVLCFSSPQERPEGFSASELELVQFIASWLGSEIERRQLIDDFEKRQNHLVEANASLETLLRSDLVTGLFNKSALEDRLEQEFARSRDFGLPLSLIALAPNNSLNYRKAKGEPAWHRLLEQLASNIEGQVRIFDTVARYDESTFVVVCPHANAETAKALAEKLQIAIAQISSAPHQLTMSVGVVSLRDNCADSEQLLAQAVGACQMAQSHSLSQHAVNLG